MFPLGVASAFGGGLGGGGDSTSSTATSRSGDVHSSSVFDAGGDFSVNSARAKPTDWIVPAVALAAVVVLAVVVLRK